MSASRLLDDETMGSTRHVDIVRVTVTALAGQTIGDAAIRERTGCTVIAIERDDGTVTDIEPETTIEPGDELVVLGTDEGVRSFEELFQ